MKSLFIVAGLLLIASYTNAQWNPNGATTGNIYYTGGNVGIGNSSPTHKLDIIGTLRTTSFISASEYITVGSGGSYRVGMNAQSDGYINGRNAALQDRFLITSNGNSYFNGGNIGIGVTNPQNKLQIGPNPQGWNGNDLVISNTINGNANSTQVLISNALDHSMMYGSADIAIRPGFGKWSIYSKGSNAYVGIGHNIPTAMLHVLQGSNTDWASMILNTGGSGKGLLIKSGSGIGESAPILQLEDNLGANRFMVRSDGRVGIGTNSPGQSLHVKGRMYLEGTESYPSGWLQNYFNWRGHSLIMGAPVGEYAHSQIELKSGGSTGGPLNTYFSMFTTAAPDVYEEKIRFSTASHSYINSGNVGIGTTNPTQKLEVKGTVYSTEVKVDVNAGTGPDYVFEPTYNLRTLAETEAYIKANKHLPEVPSAKEMEANGINLSEMNMLLLKKVEELTLHLIEQQKKNDKMQVQIEKQAIEIKNLKEKIK